MARKTKAAPEPDLSELDELEGLEEIEDEDDEPAPAPKRAPAKKAPARRTKAKPEPEPEDDEDDEDEDVEEEDEDDEVEEAPKAKRGANLKSTKKAPPAAKKATAKSSTGGRRELPAGRKGVNDISDATGIAGKDVRIWLRKTGVEKDEETNRYSWTQKQFDALVKKIQKDAA